MIMLGNTPAIAFTSPQELQVALTAILAHTVDLGRNEEAVRRLGDNAWADGLKERARIAAGLLAKLKTIQVEVPTVIVDLPPEDAVVTEHKPTNEPAAESQGSPVTP